MDEFVISEVFLGNLNGLVKKIMSQTGSIDPHEAVRLVNSGKYVLTSVKPASLENHLSVIQPFTLVGKINPFAFFHEGREDLKMSRKFERYIMSERSNVTMEVPKTTLAYSTVLIPSNDFDLVEELPEGHVFEDKSYFRAVLALLMNKSQGKGKEKGVMLVTDGNSHSNGFYVRVDGEVVTVNVYWSDDDLWICDAQPLGTPFFDPTIGWEAPERIFSATAS